MRRVERFWRKHEYERNRQPSACKYDSETAFKTGESGQRQQQLLYGLWLLPSDCSDRHITSHRGPERRAASGRTSHHVPYIDVKTIRSCIVRSIGSAIATQTRVSLHTAWKCSYTHDSHQTLVYRHFKITETVNYFYWWITLLMPCVMPQIYK